MKKMIFYIVNFVLCGLAVMGIVIASINLVEKDEFHKSIKLDNTGSASLCWKVDIDGIYPGQSVNYTVSFENRIHDSLNVNFYFENLGDISLSNYLDLEVIYNNQKLITKNVFNKYFNDEIVTFCAADETNKVTFKYTMPESVSNNAQNKIADFNLKIDINANEEGF